VLINAVDATARGIENGEWVKIFNDRERGISQIHVYL